MTARPVDAGPVLHPYPVGQVWKRGGFYVARLTGPDPKYGAGRVFLDGVAVKTRRSVEFNAKAVGEVPAWLLRRPDESCGSCGQTRPVRDTGEDVLACFESGWIDYGRVFGVDDLLTIHAAGLPGADGAWRGERCTVCAVSPVFDLEGVCGVCEDAERARGDLAALPDVEVF